MTRKEYFRRYNLKRRERRVGYNRRYYERHRKKLIADACAYQKKHKVRTNAKNRRWEKRDRKLNPWRWRLFSFCKELSGYGLTPEWFAAQLKKQRGVCAICKGPEIRWRVRRLSVDHNHKTGKERGLLCSRCNYALGHLEKGEPLRVKHTPNWIKKAIAYLQKYRV